MAQNSQLLAGGKPATRERRGSGECQGAPDLGIVDFWIVDGKNIVVAPYVKGMPKLPKGYTAVY